MDFEIWWAFVFALSVLGIQAFQKITLALIERKKNAAPGALQELSRKLDQVAQSVDTTAIEVERIGEAQRFLTRIMSEREKQRIGAPDDQISSR